MREIKFRAWIRSYHGGPFTMMPKAMVKTEAVYLSLDMEVKPGIGYEDTIIMQYTGLTDKNGRDIYEGDIVRVRQPWNSQHPEIIDSVSCNDITDWVWADFGNIFQALTYDDDTEVIGNIYENPELLK